VPVRTVTGESATGTGRPREAVPQAVAGSNVVQVEQTLDTSAPVLGNYSPVSTTGRPAGSTSGQGQQRWTSRYAVWTALVVVVGSALALVIGRFVVLRKDKGESTTAPIEQVRFQKLTDSGDVVFPTISPNGELLAYVRHEDQEESVWVKQIATGSSVQTLPPSRKGYRSLAFSPDGRYLFFREEADAGGIYRTSVFGGAARKVADNVWSDFSISPDGAQLAFVRRDSGRNSHLLVLSNVDGSGERELSARQAPLDYRGTCGWSPDGKRIVIAGGLQYQFFPKLLTIDVAAGQETELKTPRWRAIQHALWTPNGKHLIVSAR